MSSYWRRPRGDAPPPPRSSRHANRKRQEKLRRLSVDTRACIRSLAGAIALGTLCLRWSCFDRVADLQWVRDRRGTQFPFVLKPYVSVCLIVYLSICLSVLCIHMLKDCVCVCVCVCVWLVVQWRRSCRRYLVSRSDCAYVLFFDFWKKFRVPKQQFGTPWGAKSSNFAPPRNALMPYVNREAGPRFFLGPFLGLNWS